MKKLLNICKDRSYLVIKLTLSCVLTVLMISGSLVANGKRFEIIELLWIAIAFILFFVILSIVYFFLDHTSTEKKVAQSEKVIGSNTVFIISFVMLILFYSLGFLSLYPGIFAFDAPAQLIMYLTDQISEWHPVLHTVILGKIMESAYAFSGSLITGAALYTIFQYVFIALCFSYLIRYLYVTCGKLMICIISCLFLAVFPPISLQALSVTKDSLFMAFFALTITLTVELLDDEEAFYKNRMKTLALIISVTGMLIFRNNCVYAAPVLIVGMFIICKERKKLTILVTITAIMFMLYKLVFVPAYVTVKVNDCEKLSVPSQQLVKIYKDDDSILSVEDRGFIEKIILKEGIDGYVPACADIVKASIDMTYYYNNPDQVRKMWWHIVCNNPKQAVMAFAELNCGFWYPIYDLTLYGDGTKGYWVVDCYYPVDMESKIPALLKYYKWFEKTDFNGLRSLLYIPFAPATFFYLFCVMLGFAVHRKDKAFIAVFCYTLAYWATYLWGPMALVRYTTYMYAITPLYFVLILKNPECKAGFEETAAE